MLLLLMTVDFGSRIGIRTDTVDAVEVIGPRGRVLGRKMTAKEVPLGSGLRKVFLKILNDDALLFYDLPELIILGSERVAFRGDLLHSGINILERHLGRSVAVSVPLGGGIGPGALRHDTSKRERMSRQ